MRLLTLTRIKRTLEAGYSRRYYETCLMVINVNCVAARGRMANSVVGCAADLERSRAKSSFASHQIFVRTIVV
jgi:hypothetical protein